MANIESIFINVNLWQFLDEHRPHVIMIVEHKLSERDKMAEEVELLSPSEIRYTRAKPRVINPLVTCDITLDAIKSLPEFSGHPGTYVSWREAAHNAYELFKRYDGSERHYQAVTILRNKVRGAADAVLSSFNTLLNFNAIIARLDFTYADKRPTYLIEQELSTLIQGSMSCLEFYDEVEKTNIISK